MYQYSHKNIQSFMYFISVFQYIKIYFLQNHEFLFVIVIANKRFYKINWFFLRLIIITIYINYLFRQKEWINNKLNINNNNKLIIININYLYNNSMQAIKIIYLVWIKNRYNFFTNSIYRSINITTMTSFFILSVEKVLFWFSHCRFSHVIKFPCVNLFLLSKKDGKWECCVKHGR